MSQAPIRGPDKIRHRIEEITLEPTTSKYPISLKVLVDKVEVFRLQEIARSQPLHWTSVPACNVSRESEVTIQVYEKHTFGRKRVALVQYTVSAVEGQREVKIPGSGSPAYIAKMAFFNPRPDEDVAAAALARAQEQAATRQRRVLEKLGPTRNAIKTILDFGTAVAELHPTAKAVLAICNTAWQKLEAQERCDESVEKLVTGLSGILPLVAIVEKAAKLPHLQSTVGSLLHLIEDASRFIVEYHTEGQTGQTARSLANPTAQVRVDELLQRLRDLKEEFDRGMAVQMFLQDQRTLLDKLKPVGKARYDPGRACLAGTRTDIIEKITTWCKTSHDPNRLLWVHGQAGLGKSTIATSVCQQLGDNVLAVSFFCKRDDQERRDPQRVLTTFIHGLARRHPAYAKALATAIRQDSSICVSPAETQYNNLIVELFQLPEVSTAAGTLVLVVDALDECGDPSTRRRLLGQLHSMSRMVNWLKVVVTSRPDWDITGYFNLPSSLHTALDVHRYRASDDVHTFVHHRLRDSPNASSLPPDAGAKIAEKADGLFIWAHTACEFILGGNKPSRRLKLLLENTSTADALDALYSTAIEASVRDGGKDNMQDVQQCLGTIIACSTRTPLPIPTLCEILGSRIDQEVLESVVGSLRSVLYTDETQGGAVRVYHPSFADYINRRKPDHRLYMDLPKRNAELAKGCLETMVAKLRFNICDIKTSYVRNKDIPNLDKSAITNGLRYSSEFWTSHLVEAEKESSISPDGELLNGVLNGPRILFWVEMLSLIGKLNAALPSLRDLKGWCEGTSQLGIVNDMERFVQMFYTPISESTPHLYISGLAFLPKKSWLEELRKKRFVNTLEVGRGRQATWSSLQHCIVLESEVDSVTVSADGHRIASGSRDNTVRVWDAHTGAPIGEPLTGHSDRVTSVAFSADGHRIVSGSRDNTVRVWDAHTGAPIGEPLTGHSYSVTSVAFSGDGHRIVSGSDDNTLRVWDARTGAPIGEPLTGHSSWVTSVAFSGDGHRIVSGSYDETVRVWDAHTGAPIGEPLTGHSDPVTSVAFSGDGHRIVSGSWDKTVRVWDAHTGTPIGEPLTGHSYSVTSVASSGDGNRIVSGSHDNTVRVWDAHTGAPIGEPLTGHSDLVTSVAFSGDGHRIVSGSYDKTVRVWDVHTGAPIGEPLTGHSDSVTSVAFSGDGHRIVSGSYDNAVRVWDAHTGAPIGEPLTGHSSLVTSVAFSGDGHRIVSGSRDNTVRVWDAHTGAPIGEPLTGHSSRVTSVAFSGDGHRIVSGSRDKTVRVWDAHTGAPIGEPLTGHSYSVTSVAFSGDGHRIVSGSRDNTVRVWDAHTGAPIGEPLTGHSSFVTSVAFSGDGHRIVSGSGDKTVRVWDAHTGAPIGEPLTGHSHFVTSVAFSGDSHRIVSGSDDNTVRVWEVDTGDEIRHRWNLSNIPLSRSTSASPSSLYRSPDGWVYAQDGQLLLWIPPDYRRPIRDASLFAIGSAPLSAPVWADTSNFVHGEDWAKVHRSTR